MTKHYGNSLLDRLVDGAARSETWEDGDQQAWRLPGFLLVLSSKVLKCLRGVQSIPWEALNWRPCTCAILACGLAYMIVGTTLGPMPVIPIGEEAAQ